MPYPIVEMRLMHMKEAILQAFSAQQLAEDKDVQLAVEEAIKNFDVKAHIRRETEALLAAEVKECIRDAVGKAFWNDDTFRNKIVDLVRKAILDRVFPEEGA
jgi:imidazolonepropionase-like amidohydrolase